MNRSFFITLLLALFSSAAGTGAAATLIYDNGAPNLQDGFELTHWKEADRFTLNAAASLGHVQFWDLEFSSDFQSSVFWEIRSNTSNDTPGSVLFSGTSTNLTHVATGRNASPYPEYVINFDMSSVSLPAGVYWLVLHNGPLSYNAHQEIVWETATSNRTDPTYADEAPFNNNWLSNSIDNSPSQMAFQLTGIAGPVITAFGFTGSGMPRISFTTIAGQHYRVDYKNNMSDASWSVVSGAQMVSGTGNVVPVTDPDPTVPSLMHRFYRVVLL